MLEGLRIVEIGEGMAVQVAGLMLSQLGGDVLKIEPQGGDPARGTAPFANWNRGKRSLLCDVEQHLSVIHDRLRGADVLLHQFSPAKGAALGLDDDNLRALYPQLVICGVTGSPRGHPDVERSDDELLVAARLGVFYENDGHRAGPIVYRYRMGGWAAAHLAASGILARLIDRFQTGKGGAAHTSILQGYLSKLPLVWGRNSAGPMPNPPTYPFAARPASVQMFECAGGEWLQIMDPARQFDYGSMPTMWDVMAEGVDIDSDDGVRDAFRRRPLAQWLADLRAADVAAEPAAALGAMLQHPEVSVNGYSAQVDDIYLGQTLQPNVPFHVNGAPVAAPPAPMVGEGGDRPWTVRADTPPHAAPMTRDSRETGGAADDKILSGVRVLDLGMFLAGPMGPSMMGDMGADVIKVEALTGDRIRFMHRYYQAAARSKRSLALDLTRPEAQPILERLIGWADVVHHNMRMKGAEKLGLGIGNIRRINPQAVTSYVSAYGQLGDRGNWPGYDSIFAALAGWEFENAGAGNPPIFSRPGTMDVTAAQSCLVEILAGLYAKYNGKDAAHVETSLLGVAAFTQGELLMDAAGQLTPTFHLNSDQTGFSPYHRIYRCRDDVWIAVAAHRDAQQQAMRTLLGGVEERFAAVVQGRDAEEWMTAMEAVSVPVDLVLFDDAMNRFFDDPLNQRLGLISVLPQPLYGQVEQPGAYWDFGDKPVQFTRCCPDIGEHSDEILREIGYDDAQIAAFRDRNLIL